jgi:amino acid transporter
LKKDRDFSKVLNAGDVLVTAFGAMIGWGWVVSSGDWIQTAGVLGTVTGFMIGGLMIYFVGLTYAELTTAMPQCGGEHVFSYKAFGSVGSFICTWAIILSYIGVVCFEACSLPTIIQYIFPGFLKGYLYTVVGFDVYASWLFVAVIAAVIITYINIRGIKAAAILQTILTAVIAAVGITLVIVSALRGEASNLTGQIFAGSGENLIKNTLSVAVIAPFFLFGFDVIPQAAEEINVPLKKLGKILILSIVLAVSFYALVVLAIGCAMNAEEIDNSVHTSSLVAADAMSKLFNSDVMAKVLIIGGMCGIVTSWNSFLIGGSRAMFSMAESYMIPIAFAKLHKKYKTPVNALLLIGTLSAIAPFFGRVMLVWIANTASFACCIAYCMVSISFLVLRKKEPDMYRPFKIKRYRLVGSLAVIMSGCMAAMYIIPNSGSTLSIQEWVIAGGWTLLGCIFAVSCKLKYRTNFGVHAGIYSTNIQEWKEEG